jgi:undecaprenyl-phosphate 4-deoxy-4-formamido-L-arabinose transferase
METSKMSSLPSAGSQVSAPGSESPPASRRAGPEALYLSVVIPVFNEELNLLDLQRRVVGALESIGKKWEVIYVDDGSTDRSLEILSSFAASDPRVCVLEFNRNYGQHAAIFAGMAASTGEIVVTLDADLQNPPEEIPRLVAKMEEGCDVVGTRRKERHDPLLRRLASKLLNRMVGGGMSDCGCMLRAYSRTVVDQIGQCREISSFIPVLATLFSRRVVEIDVAHAERNAGSSKYGLAKLINLQFDLMTGFSNVALRMMTMIGGVISLSAFALGSFLLVMRITMGSEWAQFGVFTLFAVLFFMVGMLFVCLGTLGEYIGRIYNEVLQRPRYFVRKVYGGGSR